MISKIAAAIVLSVVTLFIATPNTAFALSSKDSAKAKKLQKQLKALGDDAPAAKVIALVKKLTLLLPTKAATFVKLAIKTGAINTDDSDALTKAVTSAIQKSPNIDDSKKDALIKKTETVIVKTVPDPTPTPTPVPYGAQVIWDRVVLA